MVDVRTQLGSFGFSGLRYITQPFLTVQFQWWLQPSEDTTPNPSSGGLRYVVPKESVLETWLQYNIFAYIWILRREELHNDLAEISFGILVTQRSEWHNHTIFLMHIHYGECWRNLLFLVSYSELHIRNMSEIKSSVTNTLLPQLLDFEMKLGIMKVHLFCMNKCILGRQVTSCDFAELSRILGMWYGGDNGDLQSCHNCPICRLTRRHTGKFTLQYRERQRSKERTIYLTIRIEIKVTNNQFSVFDSIWLREEGVVERWNVPPSAMLLLCAFKCVSDLRQAENYPMLCPAVYRRT